MRNSFAGSDKYGPIHAAFWVKDSEEGHWYLYITSDQISDKSLDAAYGHVLRLAERDRRSLP